MPMLRNCLSTSLDTFSQTMCSRTIFTIHRRVVRQPNPMTPDLISVATIWPMKCLVIFTRRTWYLMSTIRTLASSTSLTRSLSVPRTPSLLSKATSTCPIHVCRRNVPSMLSFTVPIPPWFTGMTPWSVVWATWNWPPRTILLFCSPTVTTYTGDTDGALDLIRMKETHRFMASLT